MLECLKQPEWSAIIADGFYVILNEYEEVMTSPQHADVKIFYRQRFFHLVLPQLIALFSSSETGLLSLFKFKCCSD